MSDEPKALNVRLSELESAVKKLSDAITPAAGGQVPAAICSVCHPCSVCVICHVCHVCQICQICSTCRICRPICNECVCGPCIQQ